MKREWWEQFHVKVYDDFTNVKDNCVIPENIFKVTL